MDVNYLVATLATKVFPKKRMVDPAWSIRWAAVSGLYVHYNNIMVLTSDSSGPEITVDVEFTELVNIYGDGDVPSHGTTYKVDLRHPDGVDDLLELFRLCRRKARWIMFKCIAKRIAIAPFKFLMEAMQALWTV